MTLAETGVLDTIRAMPAIRVIETFASGVPRAEILERRRQALLADLFFTGTNAITEKGQLVSLDLVGNRVAGLTCGPWHVLLTVGRNELAHDLATAKEWIRSHPPRATRSVTPASARPVRPPPTARTAQARTGWATPGRSRKKLFRRVGSGACSSTRIWAWSPHVRPCRTQEE